MLRPEDQTDKDVMPNFLYNLVNSYKTIEGRGDNVTGIDTRSFGVTQVAYNALGDNKLSDYEASLKISSQNHSRLLAEVEGYNEAPKEVQTAIADLAYNAGISNVKSWRGLMNSIGKHDWKKTIMNTLDTISVNGKAMIGLAKRRAHQANKTGLLPKIKFVTQDRINGVFRYLDIDREEIFKFKPKGGVHPQSKSKELRVEYGQ